METGINNQNKTRELISKSISGDTGAFRILVKEYNGYAYAIAYKTLFNQDDARDVVQESFIRIWKHLRNFNPEIKFTTWLYKIVINLCFDRIKSRNRRKLIFKDPGEECENISITESLEKELINNEQVTLILKFAAELPPKQRMVFFLRDVQEHNISETSDLLGLSENSVKVNLFNARKTLAERLLKLEERRI